MVNRIGLLLEIFSFHIFLQPLLDLMIHNMLEINDKDGRNAIFFQKKDEYKMHKKDDVYMFFEEKSGRE